MHPITSRATLLHILEDHSTQLQIQLSRLQKGLLLCGINPETDQSWLSLVNTVCTVQGRIGVEAMAQASKNADLYEDSRGLHP